MSARHEPAVASDSSSDEQEVVVVKASKPRKRRAVVASDDERPPPTSTGSKKKRQQQQQSPPPPPPPSSQPPQPAVTPAKGLPEADDKTWQKALELALSFMVPLKVDHECLTLLPDQGTYECFRKTAQAWLNERRSFLNLTFTTQKTMAGLIGRFLLQFILHTCGLITSKWNPSGVVVWEHKSGPSGLRCLHGTAMVTKDYVIEMDVSSENGQRALKEKPDRTKVVTNKWGRGVVQLRNDDAACCFQDAAMQSGGGR